MHASLAVRCQPFAGVDTGHQVNAQRLAFSPGVFLHLPVAGNLQALEAAQQKLLTQAPLADRSATW